MGNFSEKKCDVLPPRGKHTWDKIKCLPQIFTFSLFLKCDTSGAELTLQGRLVTEGGGEVSYLSLS